MGCGMIKNSGRLKSEVTDRDLLNIFLYSIIIVMPFIITTEISPYYVRGKVIYLYIISVMIVISLVKMKWRCKFNLEKGILLSFSIGILLSTVNSIDRRIAIWGNENRWEGMIIYLIYGCIFIVSMEYFRMYKFTKDIICITGSIMSICAVLQYYKIDFIKSILLKSDKISTVGTIGNRNFLSTYLLMFLILSIGIYIFYKKNRYLLYSGIIFSGILVTYTRSGWLALVICSIIGLFYALKGKDCLKRCGIIIIVFIMIFIFLELTGKGGFISRFNTIVTDVIEMSDNSGSSRISIWKITLNSIRKNPFQGTGPDTLHLRLKRDNNEWFESYRIKHNSYIDKAHNEFLEYWACGGIITLISYIALLGVILTKLFKRRGDDGCKIYFLMILGYVIQSFFNISVIGVAPLYWILLGAAVKHYRDLDKAKEVQAIAE